jgi:hypothetical protein
MQPAFGDCHALCLVDTGERWRVQNGTCVVCVQSDGWQTPYTHSIQSDYARVMHVDALCRCDGNPVAIMILLAVARAPRLPSVDSKIVCRVILATSWAAY